MMWRTSIGTLVGLLLLSGCPDQGITKFNASPEATIASHAEGAEVLEAYTVEFMGNVSDRDNASETLLVTWYSENTVVCPETQAPADGLVYCEHVITATDRSIRLEVFDPEGASVSTKVGLTVVPTATPEVAIEHPVPTGVYYSDQPIAFVGRVTDAEDDEEVLVASWASDVDGELSEVLATPNAMGEVEGEGSLSEGEHALQLHATDSTGKTGSVSVIVQVGPPNSAPTCAILSPESGSAGVVGEVVTFTGEAADVDVPSNWLAVAWSSDQDGDLGASLPASDGAVAFPFSGLTEGAHTITMTVTDEVGLSCTTSSVFTVGTPPHILVETPLSGEMANEFDSVLFRATVTDDQDDSTALTVEWSSDVDGVLSTASPNVDGVVEFSLTTLSIGTHIFTLTATDTDGLYTTAGRLFLVNGLPSAPVVSLSPVDPDTEEGLSVSIDSASVDPEGDPITYAFSWTQNGSPSTASTMELLPSSATTKGDVWAVSVVPNDGYGDGVAGEASVTIGNTPPVLSGVVLTPTGATVGDTLECTPGTATDADAADTVALSYSWYVDGSLVSGATTSELSSDSFTKDQAVVCAVTPGDGEDDGLAVDSNTVVIANSAPTASAVSISPDPAWAADTLTCRWTFSDPDSSDSDQSTVVWSQGTTVLGTGATLSGAFRGGDTVDCTVTPDDGFDAGTSVTVSVDIENSAPVLDEVGLTPETAFEASTLTCTPGAVTDDDGDAVSFTYSWTVNSMALSVTANTLDGADFDKGDSVSCEVTPSDGATSGTAVSSNAVEIGNTAPTITSVSLSPDPARTDDSLLATVVASDVDTLDTLSYSYTWHNGGVPLSVTGSSLSGTSWFVKNDVITVQVVANDGMDDSVAVMSPRLTIANTPPTAPSVAITPTEPEARRDDLVCEVDSESSDLDGDSITYTMTWRVNGSPYSGALFETTHVGDTVPADATRRDDVWECTATPHDGDEYGAAGTASVTVISCTQLACADAKWTGENSADWAGISVASAGDLNKDGYADVIVGAPKLDTASSDVGGAYVLLGSSTGIPSMSLDLADATLTGENATDYAGFSVAGTGDVNADGYDDVVIGAHRNNGGGSYSGAAYLVMGSSAGISDMSLASADAKWSGESSSDLAGRAVSGAGDVNKDGYSDVLVGAYGDNTKGTYSGAAYLLMGSASGIPDMGLASADAKFTAEASGDYVGWAVASGGDIDGDGYDDVLLGAYKIDTTHTDAGGAYVLLGSFTGIASMTLNLADTKITGEGASDYAGFALAGAGDVNGDGYSDVVIGAYGEDTEGTDAGAAYLVLGSISGIADMDLGSADAKWTGTMGSDKAGKSVAVPGDVDDDGYDDVLIGAPGALDGMNVSGVAYLMLGSSAGIGSGSLSDADMFWAGEANMDRAGEMVAGAGDVNKDGIDDILVGAFGESTAGSAAGAAYLILWW